MIGPPDATPEIRPSGARLYRIAWTLYLVLAIGGALWIGVREDGRVPLALFVDLDTYWADAGIGFAAGGLLLALWALGRRYLTRARELEAALGSLLAGLSGADAIGLALISGFAEEILFRGAIQGSWGLVAATLLFALLHTGPGPAFRLWSVFAGVAGLLFGLLVLWRGNLLPAIVAHALVNAVNLHRLATSRSAA